jgi:hypothetical protein
MAAPPPLWQHEVASLGRDQTSKLPVVPISSRAAATGLDGGEEKLSETWRHIKGVARDDAKQYDLMDLVRNARREDTYQFPVPGVSRACRTSAAERMQPDLQCMHCTMSGAAHQIMQCPADIAGSSDGSWPLSYAHVQYRTQRTRSPPQAASNSRA